MNFDQPNYTVLQAAEAIGWHAQTLRNYLAKGLFAWQESDSKAKMSGSKSLISFRSVLRLGLTYQLWTLGIPPKDAFVAALAFCDSGSPAPEDGHSNRLPGQLFADPYQTLLLWKPGHKGHVFPLGTGDDAVSNIEVLASDPFNGAPGAVAVVNVSEVRSKIARALKLEV